MSFNLRAGVPARPKVPGHTPNPLSTSHETNPYNPISKPDPNGVASRHTYNNSHPKHLLDFHGGHFGPHEEHGASFGVHIPVHPEPIYTDGLGIELVHEEMHHKTKRPEKWYSGAVRLESKTAPEGSTRESMTKENKTNGRNLLIGKPGSFLGVDDDKLVRKVLHDMKSRGAPYELLESVQGMY